MTRRSPVSIRKSAIHGLGAFAKRNLVAGRCLGFYRGERLSRAQFEQRYRGKKRATYVLQVDGHFIDARDPNKANWARYINDPRNTGLIPNVEFGEGGSIWTTRFVPAGSELLIEYGDAYWVEAS